MLRQHLLRAAALGAGCFCCAMLAHADADDAPKRDWNLTVGSGVTTYPEFPGSDSTKTQWFPVITGNYGHFFIGDPAGDGGGGVGYRFVDNAHWRSSAFFSAGIVDVRRENNDPRLHGLGDIDGIERAGVAVAYTVRGSTSVSAQVRISRAVMKARS